MVLVEIVLKLVIFDIFLLVWKSNLIHPLIPFKEDNIMSILFNNNPRIYLTMLCIIADIFIIIIVIYTFYYNFRNFIIKIFAIFLDNDTFLPSKF